MDIQHKKQLPHVGIFPVPGCCVAIFRNKSLAIAFLQAAPKILKTAGMNLIELEELELELKLTQHNISKTTSAKTTAS